MEGSETHGWGRAEEGRWRGARREAHGWGRGWRGKMEGSETGGGKMEGSEMGGAWVGTGRGWRGAGGALAWVWTGLGREDGGVRGCGRGIGVDGAGECVGVDACAADVLVTRTWLHHKHHCRLLRVSAQVERSMGGGSAAPCFAEARWEVSGAVLRG